MKITDLSLRDKILQTVVARHSNEKFVTDKVGALFFFGEIITEADEMGIQKGRELLARYIDNADIPLLVTSDFENGCGSMLKGLTPLPYMMSLGAANDEQIAYDYGKATALEARSVGANWTFSPVADLNINKRNPLVNVRGIGDDPDHAARLLKQVVRGMQENGLAACAKHFPGDGVDYRDQHIVTTANSLPMEQWWQMHGKVFSEMIDGGVMSIMPGHITLPDYQKKRQGGRPLPATLSDEMIQNLLKGEMGFDGVVVTDALGMGGFLGWYKTARESQIESFKAGCDMMLWPTAEYVDDMIEAVENGYISMERLDDAVGRILQMKEKIGLFKKDNHAVLLTPQEREFVANTQKRTAEASITLLRDESSLFPLSPEKQKKIAVIPTTHFEPSLKEGELLCEELNKRGFAADFIRNPTARQWKELAESHDVLMFAVFSRPFRPIGFLDFMGDEAAKVADCGKYGVDKTVVVSFGSPYFAEQYFERIPTCVNAYSMLSPSVKAFVRAATGEIPFSTFSPVELQD